MLVEPVGEEFLVFDHLAQITVGGGDDADVALSPEQTNPDFRPRDPVCQDVPPSPPLPPDGKFTVTATFKEPGTYVLRALARDRALKTTRDVTVTVTR